jgi:hypothetical protein
MENCEQDQFGILIVLHLQTATVKLINGNLTMGIESVRHFGLIYSIMKILDVIYRRWNEVKAAGQPLNKDVLIAYLDNALNYISEAIPRRK